MSVYKRDPFKRNMTLVRIIHNTLDDIEIKTKIMVHNDPNIFEQLKEWQDGKVPDSYFKEVLNKYIDRLNGEENE